MLCEIADRQSLAAPQLAGLRRDLGGDRLDQCRFSGAVDTQNADAVTRAYR
jgi:hypothetical protein